VRQRLFLSVKHISIRFDWRTSLVVACTVVLWASAFAGIRAGLQSYTPQSVALLRYLTASAVLLVYAVLTRMPLPRRRDLPGLALAGFLGFTLYNVALNIGEQSIPAGTASLIVASAPIYVALFATLALHERLKLWGWLGILLSFAGVAIVTIKPGAGLQISPSALLVLGAALTQAVYSVGQKPYLQRYSPLQFTACAIWFGTLFLLIFTPDLLRQLPSASSSSTQAVIYMGVFPGAIGYLGWSYVLSHIPASRAGSFLYMVPAAAIIIAWFWLGEVPAPSALLGGVLILAGIVLVNVIGKAR
jgi:drug/metabolite transporter (DMT)-like permease